MKRLVLAATLCAVVLLGLATAASAEPFKAKHSPLPKRAPHTTQGPLRHTPQAKQAGTGTINLTLLKFLSSSDAVGNADIFCSVADYWYGDVTNDAGKVTFTGVPAADGDGYLSADFSGLNYSTSYELLNLTWPAAGKAYTLRPTHLQINLERSNEPWNTWEDVTIACSIYNGGEEYKATTNEPVPSSMSIIPTIIDAIAPTDGTYSNIKVAAKFWNNQGVEVSRSGNTIYVAGSTLSPPGGAITLDQSNAQMIMSGGWGSGKPGSKQTMALEKYPAGWVNEIYGFADAPKSIYKSFGMMTMNGAARQTKKITIPKNAPAGYGYVIGAEHIGGPLDLYDWFQVCTLKPSKANVRKGSSIKLSGIVPIQGHLGSVKGKAKSVTIYQTTSAKVGKSQPKYMGGAKYKWAGKGKNTWKKVATVRTNRLGKYVKKSLKPNKTTWYCVWYPGDNWYYPSWTSPAKVTVRR